MELKNNPQLQLESLALSRLRWQCRRGMLELDLILNLFLEQAYLNLTDFEQKTFQDLLAFPDPTLYMWLLRPAEAEGANPLDASMPLPESLSENLQQMVSKIRANAK